MAGDWIKMRADLDSDPSVIGIARETGLNELDVVGRLWRFWAWADQQTTDGNARGVTFAWLDRYVGAAGFAQAMQNMGWLVGSEGGIAIPKFERHNGKSGKTRALCRNRAQRFRNATSVTTALPEKRREEKRREEDAAHPPPPPKPPLSGELPKAGKKEEETAGKGKPVWDGSIPLAWRGEIVRAWNAEAKGRPASARDAQHLNDAVWGISREESLTPADRADPFAFLVRRIGEYLRSEEATKAAGRFCTTLGHFLHKGKWLESAEQWNHAAEDVAEVDPQLERFRKRRAEREHQAG